MALTGETTADAAALRDLVERVEHESDTERHERQQRCREAALERYSSSVVGPIVLAVLRDAAQEATRTR